MRTTGIIIGVLAVALTFATAWTLLQSEPDEAATAPAQTRHQDRPAADSRLNKDDAPAKAPPGTTDRRQAGRPNGRNPGRDSAGSTDESDRPESTEAGSTSPCMRRTESDNAQNGEKDGPERPAFITGHDRPRGQTRGGSRPRARRIRNAAGVKDLSEVDAKLKQDRRGLYACYWDLGNDDINGRNAAPDGDPRHIRIDRQVWFPDTEAFAGLPFSPMRFAAVWEGFLVIDEPGDYWFFLGADNGGRVEIDGETVLLQDGMVRYVEVSTTLTLEAGLHPIRIEFAQFDNGVQDWRKCAASFMHVPEGESKPVPVPPEMLMVPEWMWSDEAPIITGLSAHEGEIGDEITIHGRNLYEAFDPGDGLSDIYPKVTFAGEPAEVLEKSSTRLRVKVPIGAQTGEVIVYRLKREGDGNGSSAMPTTGLRPGPSDIPSNGADFRVTTQFGLIAEWHDLSGWSNFGFEALDGRQPELTRQEEQPGRESDPPGFGVCAIVWRGRIGLSEALLYEPSPTGPTINGSDSPKLLVHGLAPFRLKIGAEVVESSLGRESIHVASVPGSSLTSGYADIVLEMLVSDHHDEAYWDLGYKRRIGEVEVEGESVPVIDTTMLDSRFFFPPEQPSKPPEIRDVEPELDSQPVVPYDVDDSRPSVAEGQEFTFTLIQHGAGDSGRPDVTVDDVEVEYTVTDETHPSGDARELTCRALMPKGVGEGRMVASVADVEGEPVFIDIRNKGLIAYLYDVPGSGGLNSLPDLAPLTCFKVRKDRAINFETANDFDLPFPAETFVIEWLGGLVIEEEGEYEFTCRSDDGMKLWLDGNVVIDADHRQAPAENSGSVYLVPGTYSFRMRYFENAQHEVCVLEWAATRGEEVIIPREVIPAHALTNDVHPPLPNKTSTGLRTDGSTPGE